MAAKKVTDIPKLVRSNFRAWQKKDRALIESILADDFHFTSPLDNRLDRAAYFETCWPHSKDLESYKIVNLVVDGNKAFITYEVVVAGKRFRNSEVHKVRGGKIADVEVYFGWSIPHEAPVGTHIDPK